MKIIGMTLMTLGVLSLGVGAYGGYKYYEWYQLYHPKCPPHWISANDGTGDCVIRFELGGDGQWHQSSPEPK